VRRYIGEIDAHIRGAGFTRLVPDRAIDGGSEASRRAANCIRMLESGRPPGVIRHAGALPSWIDNGPSRSTWRTTARPALSTKAGADHGSALIGGYDQALPVQSHDGYFRGRHRASRSRASWKAVAGRAPERRRVARPGLLGLGGTEPTVTDANLVLGRLAAVASSAARCRSTSRRRSARSPRWRPARHGRHHGGRRHSAHAAHHVLCGQGVTTERGLDAGDFVLFAMGVPGPVAPVAVAR